jgi:GntR family transcriptional repressor for pyruvate dehydrogenase complex
MRFEPVIHKNLSTLVADEIRTSIVANNLSPGDRLPPTAEIARHLGVSSPSVRKAITILSAAGIVVSGKRKCTLVKSVRKLRGDVLLPLLQPPRHKQRRK